jgi:hypothetical protein
MMADVALDPDGAPLDRGGFGDVRPLGGLPAPKESLVGASAAGVALGSLVNALRETPHQSFHFTNEGWFGRKTYAGGGDKTSHFATYAILSRELSFAYRALGFSEKEAILLGFGVATAGGLLTEIGDGATFFGFSYEDLVMDAAGAGVAALVTATHTNDLFGVRTGFLPSHGDETCCEVEGKGGDYSNLIQSADLKLAGVGDRLGVNIGPLRYLLLSVTYGTKHYPSGIPELRERQVGLEVGLNFQAILDDVGVRRNTWWGYGLHLVFDNVRFPFTAVGFRYDLNHDRWRGPDSGQGFSTR